MIVIISAQQADAAGPADPRFGRAQYFIKYNTDNGEWQAMPNQAVGQSGGAGVSAAQFAIDQHADAVISGDFGPHAARALSAGSIAMYRIPQDGQTVQQLVEAFQAGQLTEFNA